MEDGDADEAVGVDCVSEWVSVSERSGFIIICVEVGEVMVGLGGVVTVRMPYLPKKSHRWWV